MLVGMRVLEGAHLNVRRKCTLNVCDPNAMGAPCDASKAHHQHISEKASKGGLRLLSDHARHVY